MDSNKIKRGLGRGLSSLIGETKVEFQKNKVSIISEIHPQHHGSMDEIKRMILQSKIGGADYVKVQLYSSQNLFKNDERKYIEIDKTELKEISDSFSKLSFQLAVSRSRQKSKHTDDTDFIPVKNPKSDDFLYVTVDGNRRITLTEVSDREVRARFTDLLTEKKIKR